MSLFTPAHRQFAQAFSDWALSNPFAERQTRRAERQLEDMVRQGVLGDLPIPEAIPVVPGRPHAALAIAAADALAGRLHERLNHARGDVSAEDYRLYTDVANTVLYFRFRDQLQSVLEEGKRRGGRDEVSCYREFDKQWNRFFGLPTRHTYALQSAAHCFACFFQVRRGFSEIQQRIIGRSAAAASLRAEVWHSIFTCDFLRHGQLQFDRMHEISTLIIGPSGTGKELVAQAIGLSRHIPFDAESRRFEENFVGAFHTVHIAALAETLLESELFGHAKGAFTGATAARRGWFEECRRPLDSVFLDEIGEVSPLVQVKLLRVLQDRTFQRLGETTARTFNGKLLAATNRDLAAEVDAGRFREDLYYRLCADVVRTPSLHEQIAGDRNELEHLVRFVSTRVIDDESEGQRLANDALQFIESSLGLDYPWPGNFRELEQCVKSILIRRKYTPLRRSTANEATKLLDEINSAVLSLEELSQRYCQIVHHKAGSYAAAARRLGIDQRTVKRYVTGDNDG